jgi:hypothetical protein
MGGSRGRGTLDLTPAPLTAAGTRLGLGLAPSRGAASDGAKAMVAANITRLNLTKGMPGLVRASVN